MSLKPITRDEMSLKPITRDEMRGLKAKKDEENRLREINNIVKEIYNMTIQNAEQTSESSFKYPVRHPSYETNITDILSGLQVLFPECLIEYKNQCLGLDGKWYDISLIDDMMKQFIDMKKNRIQTQKNIVIDWS
jgi:hypothetical protein